MPLVIPNCETNGGLGRRAYSDGEIKHLLTLDLVVSCPHCTRHHFGPSATYENVMAAIYIEVERVGHSLQ